MLKATNRNLAQLAPSGIRRISALAAARPGCISLALGEPDFTTPDAICDEVARALARGETHYPPNNGTAELRRAIAAYMTGQGIERAAEDIIVTVGATEALSSTFRALIDPGDEVIVPVPAFTVYASDVRACGGTVVELDTTRSAFQITPDDLAACVSAATKAIVICSPNNPTGCVLDTPSLDAVAQLAAEQGVYVVCDDVYNRLVYEGAYERFAARHPELADRTVVIDSFSKPWAMTGWRVGWLAATSPVVDEIAKAHQFAVSSVPAFIMPAAARALEVDPAPMVAAFRARRERVVHALADMGLGCNVPTGAFYAFPSIAQTGLDDEAFCERAIREAGVALVPGGCFGVPGHVRLSYCVADDALDEGLSRLAGFVDTLI